MKLFNNPENQNHINEFIIDSLDYTVIITVHKTVVAVF